jgi:hypothetical protein
VTRLVSVTKASGATQPFSADKLRRSLGRVTHDDQLVPLVVHEITRSLYENITTREIYKAAFALLRKYSRTAAGRYQLKMAIMQMGPSGFPFEKYVAKLLEHEGYDTRVNQVIEGACVKHETDVIAERNDVRAMIECKYHNTPGLKCDVKVPLYIHSRFRDIEQVWKRQNGDLTYVGWVVTNTRFTGDAIRYGMCAGLRMLGWNFPVEGSLQQLIVRSGLYPITCVTTLTKAEKEKLLSLGLVLVSDLTAQPLASMGVSPARSRKVLDECQVLAIADEYH